MKQSEKNMLTGIKMFCASMIEEMRTVRNKDNKTMSTVTLLARGGWQSFLWLWDAMGYLAYREDFDGGDGGGGGAEDGELMWAIIVLK